MTNSISRRSRLFVPAIFAVLLNSCGALDKPNPPPDMTGTWTGSFAGNSGTTIDISANVTSQSGVDFSGTWSSPSISGSLTGRLSQHYLINTYDYYSALIQFDSSTIVECCYVLTGCQMMGNQEVQIDGNVNGDTIPGDTVVYIAGCYNFEYGMLTLTRTT